MKALIYIMYFVLVIAFALFIGNTSIDIHGGNVSISIERPIAVILFLLTIMAVVFEL